jgi:hypothetical protein
LNDAAVPVASVDPAVPDPASTLTVRRLANADVGAPGVVKVVAVLAVDATPTS